MPKRILKGAVINDKTDKTVVILVTRSLMHKKYKKVISVSKKYHAHDQENKFALGDIVRIQETKPISKLKRWVVLDKNKEVKIK